jgi:hypothetical protein
MRMGYQFCDCHTHSEFSSCAEDVTLRGYSRRAQKTSLRFAITDHSAQVFYPPDNRWGFWTDRAVEVFESCRSAGGRRILEYVAAVRAAQRGNMLVGTLPGGRAEHARRGAGRGALDARPAP